MMKSYGSGNVRLFRVSIVPFLQNTTSIYNVTSRVIVLLGISVLVLFATDHWACLDIFTRVASNGAVRFSSWLDMFNEAGLAMEIAGGGAALAETHS